MNKKTPLIVISILVVGVIILGIAAFANSKSNNISSDKMMKETSIPLSAPVTKDDAMMKKTEDLTTKDDSKMDGSSNKTSGIYIPYDSSKLTAKKNVIFFAASWCPTCQALNRAINENTTSIPSNLTILKADYDTETQLKQKYGVTYQHTLVEVDQNGKLIKKWSGSYSIDEIVNQLI